MRLLPSQERRWVFAVATHAGMVLDEGGYGAMGNCRDSDMSAARGSMSGLGVAGDAMRRLRFVNERGKKCCAAINAG